MTRLVQLEAITPVILTPPYQQSFIASDYLGINVQMYLLFVLLYSTLFSNMRFFALPKPSTLFVVSFKLFLPICSN